MHLPVNRRVVAFILVIPDFVTLGQSPPSSELQLSSINAAATLRLPTGWVDHLTFEIILV